MAVEDAYALYRALAAATSSASSSGGSVSSGAVNNLDMSAALLSYEKERAPRVRKMHLLSNAAQATGHMRLPVLNRVRDLALRCVPSAVKGWVFDQVLRFTVSR